MTYDAVFMLCFVAFACYHLLVNKDLYNLLQTILSNYKFVKNLRHVTINDQLQRNENETILMLLETLISPQLVAEQTVQ